MFFFLPYGLDEQKVNRLPWVTITLAALCVLAFLGTNFREDTAGRPMGEALLYWREHPQLEGPPALRALYGDRLDRWIADARKDSTALATEEEQAALNQKVERAMIEVETEPSYRYGLVPVRGLRQIGWLTYMFLHAGFLHILGNFLFLYLVGPLLEDVWGRPLFLAFYLLGGVVAGAAQFLADTHGAHPIVGASGAIAACMGAFMLRFADRRVRTFYFAWVLKMFYGTFMIRAWLWGLLWVGSEIFSLATEGAHGGGVAVLAHVGGFAFGAAFALGIKFSGVERTHLAPALEAKVEGWTLNEQVARAQDALQAGDRGSARAAFEAALKREPGNRDATFGLAKMELEEGRLAQGSRLLERALNVPLTQNDHEAVRNAVEDLGPAFHPESVKPTLAYRIAQALEAAQLPALAERTYAAAGAGVGTLGAKALLRAAELRLQSHTDVKVAQGYLDRLQALPDVPADMAAKAEEVRGALAVHGTPGGGRQIALEESPDSASSGKTTVRRAKLLAITASSLEIEDELGRKMDLPTREVLAIAVAVLPSPEHAGRNLILTDLVLSWGTHDGGRTSVLRFSGGALSLGALFPGVSPKEAYGRFLARMFEASGASGLPDKDELLKGKYPRYADLLAFESACYEITL